MNDFTRVLAGMIVAAGLLGLDAADAAADPDGTGTAPGPVVACFADPCPSVSTWRECAEVAPVGPCVWDGRHSDDGVSRSFVVRANGKVVPIPHHRAHRRLHG